MKRLLRSLTQREQKAERWHVICMSFHLRGLHTDATSCIIHQQLDSRLHRDSFNLYFLRIYVGIHGNYKHTYGSCIHMYIHRYTYVHTCDICECSMTDSRFTRERSFFETESVDLFTDVEVGQLLHAYLRHMYIELGRFVKYIGPTASFER